MEILIYNTMSGEKEPLSTQNNVPLTMYTCGPTVYDSTHLGHLIPPVVGDVVKRYLTTKGYQVKWAHNFTDVEDKIIRKASDLGIAPGQVAEQYIQEYLDVMVAMGVDTVDVFPRVSDHMDDIIQAIADLVEKGAAYAADGDVYFNVAAFPDYGRLSRRNVAELLAGARVEADPRKRAAADFALWKGAKPGEPAWPSPWGPGRPGWHIECSVMSIKHLGFPIDIHGGGIDLVFPHHENEIAQAEAHQGHGPFVRYWFHTGLLKMDAEKMSKSLGNFERAKDLLARYNPMVLRLFILSHHYRSPREYSDERLQEAQRAWQRLNNAVANLRSAGRRQDDGDSAPVTDGTGDAAGAGEAANLTARVTRIDELTIAEGPFEQAMADDFNTAQAIAVLFELVREVNVLLSAGTTVPAAGAALDKALAFLVDKGRLLGILDLTAAGSDDGGDALVDGLLTLLMGIRQEARQQRDWVLSDRIRDGLAQLGITVEDTAVGPRVRRDVAG